MAGDLTVGTLNAWGIVLLEEPMKEVCACSNPEHKGHEYMLPFYKRNDELIKVHARIIEGSDDSKKEAIQEDYMFLKEIQDSCDSCKHMD